MALLVPPSAPTPAARARGSLLARLARAVRIGLCAMALVACGNQEPDGARDAELGPPDQEAGDDAGPRPEADATIDIDEDAGGPDARTSSDDGAVSSDASARADTGTDAARTDASGADASAMLDASADAARPGCKRGVAYNDEQAGDAKAFGSSITWWYDWGANPNAGARSALEAAGVEFVPMVWSGPPRRDIDVQALIRDIPRSAKYLLGFNEPNFGAQANLTPEQAAAAWPQLEEVARARNLKLVSPAPNYCGGDCNRTDPFVWLDDFFAACKDCQVDYVAFHWYACSIEALKSITAKYETRYKRPVWLTEFACLDDPGDHSAAGQRAYMDKAVTFLESDPLVFRYSWFIGRSSQPGAIDLFAAPGALTALGNAYAGYAGACQ